MGKTLDPKEKVLYSNGDAKNGSELVKVGVVTTTPSTNSSAKPISCKKYKTLCDGLIELAAYEKKKGTDKFVNDIIEFNKVFTRKDGGVVINHHPIGGGGFDQTGPVAGMEDTEFKDPRLPYFVDLEYVEVAYALRKKGLVPSDFYLAWAGGKQLGNAGNSLAKKLWNKLTKKPEERKPVDENALGSGLDHRPNRMGLDIGDLIGKHYPTIEDFTKDFCKNECSVKKN